jgi:folylpolyglutamate synthase
MNPQTMPPRTYAAALAVLDSLITRTPGMTKDLLHERSLDTMINYVRRTQLPIDRLRAIHVAGTKGKGSTCALCESMLRAKGLKTGLYTSPHLIDVRERIRIDGQPVPKDVFSSAFWHIYDCFKKDNKEDDLPTYFRMLTLVGFRVFLEQQVDVAILEVGMGGRFDATNVIQSPIVCGISALGFDHMNVLGNTLPEIAFAKAGIMKENVPVYSVPQRADAQQVLVQCAAEVRSPLRIVASFDRIEEKNGRLIKVGLNGEHQRENAALAVSLVNTFLGRSADEVDVVDSEMIRGLEAASWPGRAQILPSLLHPALVTYYLDGAHTEESAEVCRKWYASAVGHRTDEERILVFFTSSERDPLRILPPLLYDADGSPVFDRILLCPTESLKTTLEKEKADIPLEIPDDTSACIVEDETEIKQKYYRQWEIMQAVNGLQRDHVPASPAPVHVLPSVRDSMSWIEARASSSSKPVRVLVSGSLYLVGDFLRHLQPSSE